MSLIDFENILFYYVDHIKKFNEHLVTEFNLTDLPYNVKRGVFMKRKPSDLGIFHVDESWYDSYKNKLPFTGETKNNIDLL